MAIIYSYPRVTTLNNSDLLIGTRFENEDNGTARNITFTADAILDYVSSNYSPTLDQVLTEGNVSLQDASIGTIFLYNPNAFSGNGYVYITGDKNRFNFYNNADVYYANISQDSLSFIDAAVPTRQFQITKPAIAANRTATFQDASGTIAYLSDIPTVPVSNNYGLFAQTGNSTPISGTTVETTLVNGGVGTLTIPANGFQAGDSFKAVFGGVMNAANNQTIRIKVKAGAITLLDSGVQSLTNSIINDIWSLNLDFTIRQIGGPGTASIVSLGAFHYVKTSNATTQGFAFNVVNNTTFDTTINNTLDVTVQWGSNNAGNSIYSDIFILNKTY